MPKVLTCNDERAFAWPDGARAALSLSFDDGRPSQLAEGMPVLDAYGVKATFYVSPWGVRGHEQAWIAAAARGHELGNHTLHHPCSANFAFARRQGHVLEDYTLARMDAELGEAHDWLAAATGVTATTFAYPCGQTFVGRGEDTRSYVPLVARRYRAGRRYRDEAHNDPRHTDLAQVYGMEGDGRPFSNLRAWLRATLEAGGWLVLCMHDVGDQSRQAMRTSVLDSLCRFAVDSREVLWMDTVTAVAAHIEAHTAGVSRKTSGP